MIVKHFDDGGKPPPINKKLAHAARCQIPLLAIYSPHDKPQNQLSGARAHISGAQARMPRQQCPIQQEGESRDVYSDRLLAFYHQLYPVYVGSCRYFRATTSFRAADILTHIANFARPFSEDLVVWLEILSDRYPYEWAQVLHQVRRQGGPSLNPAPIPRIEVVLKLGFFGCLWVKVQWIAWGWLARRQLRRLSLRQWQVQRRLHDVLGSATRKYRGM